MASPDPDSTSFFMDVALKAKDYSVPIAIGIAILMWKLLKYLGLGFIDDVRQLKDESSTYATKSELKDCHNDVARHIDAHFESLRKDIRDVHGRVDDIHKSILVKQITETGRTDNAAS